VFVHDLLIRLSQSRIPYCVVGGVAVNLHGVPRMTYDVDVVVVPDASALAALQALLEGMGLRSRVPVKLVDFTDPAYREQMLHERNLMAVTFTSPSDPLQEVDVLVSPSIDARELVQRAVAVDLDGTPVPVVALEDLIALKRASTRAHDADDAAHLERIRSGGPLE
jgi:hypothetical protein